ncbi:MAG: VOC family protein [Chitinophagaceae bacterium]
MQRVTGIGGIFFKCKDPEKMRQWYQTHLGIDMSPYGAKISSQTESGKEGYTLWTPFPDTTSYFGPSEQSFMINYRVADLEALVAALKEEGVTILDELVAHEYGKFIHVEDIEGNKIELWEPAE